MRTGLQVPAPSAAARQRPPPVPPGTPAGAVRAAPGDPGQHLRGVSTAAVPAHAATRAQVRPERLPTREGDVLAPWQRDTHCYCHLQRRQAALCEGDVRVLHVADNFHRTN